MLHKSIGERIKERRSDLRISAIELAERLNMSRATVHRWENGDIRQIKLPVIEAIARELNCNPAWLLGKADRKERTVDAVGDSKYKDVAVILEDVIQYLNYTETIFYKGNPIEASDKNAIVVGLTSINNMIGAKYNG